MSEFTEHSKYRLGEYREEIAPGPNCVILADGVFLLKGDHFKNLRLMFADDGQTRGIQLHMKSLCNNDAVFMFIVIMESPLSVEMDFCGFRVRFGKAAEALEFIRNVINDTLVLVELQEKGQSISRRVQTQDEARAFLDRHRFESKGCLDFVRRGKAKQMLIKSWFRGVEEFDCEL